MHELASVQSVVVELLEKKPKKARVLLGKMMSDTEHFKEMFSVFAEGTPAADVELEIVSVPVKAKCPCGFEGEIEIPSHTHFVRCPKCNKICDVLSGNEIKVEIID